MIVRERDHDFILIQQDHHAAISGDIVKQWKKDYFLGEALRSSVEFAAYQHDCGWKEFDKQPFLNDENGIPYSFYDFPVLPKIVLYKHGIDVVEQVDSYAALLCSEHYKRFLLNHTSLEAQEFVTAENTRQQAIMDARNEFNKRLFNFHYSIVQFSDNLSLYLCINEPGITKESEHSFFKEGIPMSQALQEFCNAHLQLHWKNENTVVLDDFPFEQPFDVIIKLKVIPKVDLSAKGLVASYEEAAFEEWKVTLTAP
ncbi:DUF3891 family protein [Oceanobacillus polygoni]|uniref:DUF3891 family protein n=1 Tax=Oceanobacillus polygoni TaxID=1235259 RepID=A0A9X1CLD7_9BACI|nr:DUF3891 family protein [Oceanobacillus polygoni]MBP2079993.1 hypothetical protein [Oceanobacillus polygoni]